MENAHITILGLVAGACTTIAFLPQVIKTWKSKSAKDVITSYSIHYTKLYEACAMFRYCARINVEYLQP